MYLDELILFEDGFGESKLGPEGETGVDGLCLCVLSRYFAPLFFDILRGGSSHHPRQSSDLQGLHGRLLFICAHAAVFEYMIARAIALQ